jgi:hypothetical protein
VGRIWQGARLTMRIAVIYWMFLLFAIVAIVLEARRHRNHHD